MQLPTVTEGDMTHKGFLDSLKTDPSKASSAKTSTCEGALKLLTVSGPNKKRPGRLKLRCEKCYADIVLGLPNGFPEAEGEPLDFTVLEC